MSNRELTSRELSIISAITEASLCLVRGTEREQLFIVLFGEGNAGDWLQFVGNVQHDGALIANLKRLVEQLERGGNAREGRLN